MVGDSEAVTPRTAARSGGVAGDALSRGVVMLFAVACGARWPTSISPSHSW